MEDLPPENLSLVCGFIPVRTFILLRLVNDALCVTFLPENLDKLSNVARHFGSQVRK